MVDCGCEGREGGPGAAAREDGGEEPVRVEQEEERRAAPRRAPRPAQWTSASSLSFQQLFENRLVLAATTETTLQARTPAPTSLAPHRRRVDAQVAHAVVAVPLALGRMLEADAAEVELRASGRGRQEGHGGRARGGRGARTHSRLQSSFSHAIICVHVSSSSVKLQRCRRERGRVRTSPKETRSQ